MYYRIALYIQDFTLKICPPFGQAVSISHFVRRATATLPLLFIQVIPNEIHHPLFGQLLYNCVLFDTGIVKPSESSAHTVYNRQSNPGFGLYILRDLLSRNGIYFKTLQTIFKIFYMRELYNYHRTSHSWQNIVKDCIRIQQEFTKWTRVWWRV